mgnify:CR=1 FL=1
MIDWGLIEKLYKSNTHDDVFGAVETWAENNGFYGFGLAAKFNAVVELNSIPKLICSHNYENDMSRLYDSVGRSEYDVHDPRIKGSILGLPALSYDASFNTSMPNLLDLIPSARSQIAFASECGIRSGIIAPFRLKHASWGFLNFSSDYMFSYEELDHRLGLSSHFSQAVVSTLERVFFHSNNINLLSMRERDVLRWASVGKTSWEISMILKISERTVNFHISEAARKLGVRGRRAACTSALSQGLIDLL